jgi:hypothetical protein
MLITAYVFDDNENHVPCSLRQAPPGEFCHCRIFRTSVNDERFFGISKLTL